VTQPGTELCGCTIESYPDKNGWSFFSELTSAGGGQLSLQCTNPVVSEYDLNGKNIAGPDSPLCQTGSFVSQCNDQADRHFTYTSNDGQSVSCALPSYSGIDMCGSAAVRIKPDYCEAQVPAPVGVVAGPILIRVISENPTHCVSLYQQIEGDSVNLDTSCSMQSPILEYEHSVGEFCGFAVTHDANNNVSATTQIGCRSIPPRSDWTLAPAQPVSLTPAGETRMALQWELPAQVQSMVEVELTRRDPVGLDPVRTRLPAVAQSEGGTQTLQLDVPARIADIEQWCLRLRTFAPTAQVGQPRYSNWSAPLCEQRAAAGVAPAQWLPWPQLAKVPEGEPLISRNGKDVYTLDGFGGQISVSSGLYVPLGEYIYTPLNDCQVPVYARNAYSNNDRTPPETGLYLTDLSCDFTGYAYARQVIEAHLDFMVYRQTRTPAGDHSGFVQITPMIDRVHWEPVYAKDLLVGYRLSDPFVWALADADHSRRVELAFFDRTGLLDGHEYRYQFVYFDADKRLQRWRATEWLSYESGLDGLFATPAEEEV
ncbi:MAG: hypothetical protein WD601_03600, partial [Pseudohongiellaceae bacterium]